MTTPAAEKQYLSQHMLKWEGVPYAVHNPHNKELKELPIIYGFWNGGGPGAFSGQLLAEDGTPLGSHLCSHEDYMRHDLGILEGSRSDRHEEFKKHYPDGYRMDFVGQADENAHFEEVLVLATAKLESEKVNNHD